MRILQSIQLEGDDEDVAAELLPDVKLGENSRREL
jgi:hypothetical protein